MKINHRYPTGRFVGQLALFFVFVSISVSAPVHAASEGTAAFSPDYARSVTTFRETLGALVKADTTSPPGNEARAVEILAARLSSENVPFEVMEFAPGRKNLMARLKGTGEKKPLLLLAHLDVVGTDHQNWTVPPHEMTEKDGYLYGRGVMDDLGMGVANLETFLNIKRSGIRLKRDLILAYTGDEESGGLGIKAVYEKHPEWLDAEIALNESGKLTLDAQGKVGYVNIVAAEKTYQDFLLRAEGSTGHTALPRGENSILILAQALNRLSKFQPKERLLPLSRQFFKDRAAVEPPEVAKAMLAVASARGALPEDAMKVLRKNPVLAAQFRTTCVPSIVSGGIRANALPPDAQATVNCRILPDETIEQTRKLLETLIQDPRVKISLAPPFGSGPPSPLEGAVLEGVRKVTAEIYPGIPVIPSLVMGGTDSRFLRAHGVQAYGLSPLASGDAESMRTHGVDERMVVSSIRPGLEYLYRLVLELGR